MDFPSRLDLYALGRDYVVTRAKKIDPSQVDVLGTDVNIFVGSMSVVAGELIKQLAYGLNKLLLDGAEDDDLDRWALDRYSSEIPRKGASSARGRVTFNRPDSANGAGDIPIGTRLKSNTGYEYLTTTVATFGPNDLVSSANVAASQAGKAPQVGANSIRTVVNPSELFDNTIRTVNNPLPTAGGEPAEDDQTYRNRLRRFWRVARRGVLGAIEVGAETVGGVVYAQAIESLQTLGSTTVPAKIVNLYISDSSGVASAALASDVLAALEDWRACGIPVLVSTSVPQIVSITIKPTFRANIDTATLTEAIRAAVVEFVNTLPVNGTLKIGELLSVMARFIPDGLVMSDSLIQSPIGDLVPDVGKTIRMTVADLTIVN